MTSSAGSSLPSLEIRVNQKLEEARFFLDKMVPLEDVETETANQDVKEFQFYTSAFLNSVRNPLQYLYEDIKADATKKAWYQAEVGGRPIIKFITDERNSNIHAMSTTPHVHYVKRMGDVEPMTTTFHQEWASYTLGDNRVTSVAEVALAEIRQVIEEARKQGYL